MFSAQQFGSMVGPLLGGAVATYAPLQSLFVLAGGILFTISACAWLRHGHEQNAIVYAILIRKSTKNLYLLLVYETLWVLN